MTVVYEDRDGVAIVTMDTPQTRNALSSDLLNGIGEACVRAATERASALVLTGTGRTFSSGGDLAGVNDSLRSDDATGEIGVLVDELHDVVRALRNLPMPTVAAVNGATVGAGISLALACDVRVVASSAVFVTGYISVGASPDGGASFHLARALGAPAALSSLLLNRRFTAAELLARGLADEVADDGQVTEVGTAMARGLATLSFPAVLAMRELVFAASTHDLTTHLDAEKQRFLSVAQTPEFRDGVAPFARREPAVAQA